MSNEELIAEARNYTACECRFEGVQMRGCGEHGDDESKLIADLADALEAQSAENARLMALVENYTRDYPVQVDARAKAEAALEAQSAPPGPIAQVQRNGDFQTITFADGSTVYGESEQGDSGEWRDSRGVENVIALAAQSAPLVADSREALAGAMYTAFTHKKWANADTDDRAATLATADGVLASGVVSLAADRDREMAERIEAVLPTEEPDNPFMYDPLDDDSVDPSNLNDVVHAAVSRGWDAGKFAMAETIRAAYRESEARND